MDAAMTRLRRAEGFSLADVVVATAIGAVMTAVSVPVASRMVESTQMATTTRIVERELQTARLKAVSKNRPMRVRFNCPAPGQVRIIEVTGVTATDSASNRCDESVFPYPGPADSNPATPAHDGPITRLPLLATVSGPDLQFSTRGTAMTLSGGTAKAIAGSTSLTLTRKTDTATVTINGLGRITIK
jgi:Tfp pilus assembly protein FimT